jgi:hypothetical protein
MATLLLLLTIIVLVAVGVAGALTTRRLSLRVNLVVACGFLAILLVLTLGSLLVPASALKPPLDPVKTSGIYNAAVANIAAGARSGSFDAPEGFVKKVNSFDAPADHISLSVAEPVSGAVYMGTKGADAPDDGSGKIDVYSYTCSLISINDTFYAFNVEPPAAEMNNAGLLVYQSVKKPLDVYIFSDRSTVPQFFNTDTSHQGSAVRICTVVVVLLPPGVTADYGYPVEPLS